MGRSKIATHLLAMLPALGVFIGLGGFNGFAVAQDTGKRDASTKKGAASAKSKIASPAVNADDKPVEIPPMVWSEPRRQVLMRNTFPELNGPVLTPQQQDLVLQMASGEASADQTLIRRFVESNAAELTRKANIAAVMVAEGSDLKKAHALDEAAGRLIKPLTFPPNNNNQTFRRTYLSQLNAVAKNLLQGHLLTRTLFMAVLSRVGSPEVVPLLIEQINDPDQAYMVKTLGAVGLINACQAGRRPLDPNRDAIPAATALADFLSSSEEIPWPVQVRCLEAIGVLRQSTADPARRQAEFADVAFRILCDAKAEPMARARAGWALSRLTYTGLPGSSPNLELIAHQLGEVAVASGERIASVPVPSASPTKNLGLVSRYAEPLVRILDAFVGEPELRGSGLNAMSGNGRELRGIEQRIRALTTASVQMGQSAGSQVAESKDAVIAAAKELRSYLAANPPKSLELYRGGPTLKPADPAPPANDANKAGASVDERAPEGKKQP